MLPKRATFQHLLLPLMAIFVSLATAYSGLKSEIDCTNGIRCYKNTYAKGEDTCKGILQRVAIRMEDLVVWNSHFDCHEGEKLDDATPICVDGRPMDIEDTNVCEQRGKRWAGLREWFSRKVDKVVPEKVQEVARKVTEKTVKALKKTGEFIGDIAVGYAEGKAASSQAIGDAAISVGGKVIDVVSS